MLYAFICLDKPGHLEVRMANRPAHLDYLGALKDRVTFAGPLLDDAGQSPTGSLLVIDCADFAAAQALAAGDPYAKAGLFQSVSIHPVRQVLPAA
jgi:uncharacterized protein